MLNRTITAALLSVLPLSAMADTYECTTTNFGRGGWVGKGMILEFDAQKGTAMALDFGIYQIFKKAIPVKFRKRSETSYIFSWTVDGLKASNGGSGKNSYKVTLFTDRKKFSLSGRRHGYDNVISGAGTCKKVK